MEKVKITVLGSLNYDFVTLGERIPNIGETVISNSFQMNAGGKGANQAVQAAKLGAQAILIGKIGQDFMGQNQLAGLQAIGVNTKYIETDAKEPTGVCCIHVDAGGNNALMVVPGANQTLYPSFIDNAADAIRDCDIFVCQLETNLDAVYHGIEIAHRAGRRIILDPAPVSKLDMCILSQIDIIKPNEVEAEFYTGIKRENMSLSEWGGQMAQALRDMGPKAAIVTLGKMGACYCGPEGNLYVPAFPVHSVDTTGSGDAFTAGLAVALGEGLSMHQALRFANAVGALTATSKGAQTSMKDRMEVERFLASF